MVVYNRTKAVAAKWVDKFGGSRAPTPHDASIGCDFVFACVGNDSDLRSVTLGELGAFAGMSRGAVFVDHTTASANVARELDREARRRGLAFVDAPVSGGQSGAEDGRLTVMCVGDETEYKKVEPLIAACVRSCRRMGPTGAAQLTKMVNQICIAGVVQSLSEGLRFARRRDSTDRL